jgi:hypothetical protein
MTEAPNTFDLLRSATVGNTPKLRTERVPVTHPTVGELELEVRELTHGLKQRIAKKCMVKAVGGRGTELSLDLAKYQTLMVIESCFDPGSGKKLFKLADAKAIADQAAGGWLADVQRAVGVINGDDDRKGEGGYDPADVAGLLERVADDLDEAGVYDRAEELRELAGEVLRSTEPVALGEDEEEGNS